MKRYVYPSYIDGEKCCNSECEYLLMSTEEENLAQPCWGDVSVVDEYIFYDENGEYDDHVWVHRCESHNEYGVYISPQNDKDIMYIEVDV